ncbi:hypothetical protein LXT12_15165 [Pelomonas sp. P7]|uniref:Uncharacterized protein n=1 Tax=Pelomonas caseinilytica TaxID=2906763 RepID=A0ABS8XID5_9BURK|nr:hypothetical protein [Pelomonas sp. P7]
MTVGDAYKSAVALCIQEKGGVATGCDLGTNGIPNTVATKEVASVDVKDGAITLTLADIGKDTATKTIKFDVANVVGDAVIWKTTTTVTDTVIKDAIEKNNT